MYRVLKFDRLVRYDIPQRGVLKPTSGQNQDGGQRVKVQNNLGFRLSLASLRFSFRNWAKYVKSKTVALHDDECPMSTLIWFSLVHAPHS